MKARNIAGRHGAFTTQFSKQPQMFALCGNSLTNPSTSASPPSSRARRSASKEVRTIERSRKAIERRLLLPLDEHNWIRALEVLRSRYARPGIKPEYYQRVLRAMVEPYINTKMPMYQQQETRINWMDMTNTEEKNKITSHKEDVVMTNVDHKENVDTHFNISSNNNLTNEQLLDMEKKWEGKAYTQATVSAANAFDLSNGCGNVVEGIGQIRDAVFANEIPTCASLWITLIWAYVHMNRPLEAKETIELALRRFTFSEETIVHMLRLVYSPLCMTGEFTSVKELLALIEEWQREHVDKKKTAYNFNKINKQSCDGKESKSSSTSKDLVKEYLMTREAKRLYAEAAALQGSWQCALETMHECLSLRTHAREQTSANELSSLFTTTPATTRNSNNNSDNILDLRKSKAIETGKAFTNHENKRNRHLVRDMEANNNTHLKVHDIDSSKSYNHFDVSNSSITRETTNSVNMHSTTYHNNESQSSFLATRKASKHNCLAFFTKNALSSLLTSFCVNNEVELACTCWNELYGTLHILPSLQEEEEVLLQHERNTHTTIDALPTVDHIHEMLNCLCANAQANVALDLFVALFLPTLARQRVCYESHQSASLPHFPLDAISLNIIFSAFSTREVNLQELDEEAIASTCGNKTGHNENLELSSSSFSEFTLRVATEPERVINLFDELINMREDMQITDYVMAVVGPALVLTPSFDNNVDHNYENNEEKTEYDSEQNGIDGTHKNNNLERLVQLLCQTPLLNTRKVPVHESIHQRTLKNHLMTLVYYCYFSRLSSDEVRGALLHSLPHLFPPEYFCKDLNRLAKLEDDPSITPNKQESVKLLKMMPHHKPNVIAHNYSSNANYVNSTTSNSSGKNDSNNANNKDSYVYGNVNSKQTNVLDEVERMKQIWPHWRIESTSHQISVEKQQQPEEWRRRERHHYFPLTSTARLTEQSETEMKNNFANLYKNRTHAFHGTHSAANNDPRPIPKGIHDRASGWNFVGRNGEMMFSNNYRATNLLNMQPKIMRSLTNPYRSWNPRLNSSLAHMELVKKWNKNSAM